MRTTVQGLRMLAAVLVLVILGGCGSSANNTISSPPTSASSSSTSTATPEAGSANPVPAALRGVWAQQLGSAPAQLMKLTASSFSFYVDPSDAATGPLGVAHGVLVFGASNTCSGTGTYRWRLHGSTLRFMAAGPDGCPRGSFITAAPWRRR